MCTSGGSFSHHPSEWAVPVAAGHCRTAAPPGCGPGSPPLLVGAVRTTPIRARVGDLLALVWLCFHDCPDLNVPGMVAPLCALWCVRAHGSEQTPV